MTCIKNKVRFCPSPVLQTYLVGYLLSVLSANIPIQNWLISSAHIKTRSNSFIITVFIRRTCIIIHVFEKNCGSECCKVFYNFDLISLRQRLCRDFQREYCDSCTIFDLF